MTMYFPAVPLDAGPYQALEQLQGPPRPLALVVDDEPVITESLSAILNGAGFAALIASDGVTALETALLIPPQILITDLAMPDMDGLELAVAVTQALPDCEVILFSGHASICDIAARMQELGCDFVTLLKPIPPAAMINCVRERLESRGAALPPRSSAHQLSVASIGLDDRTRIHTPPPRRSAHAGGFVSRGAAFA